MGRFCILLMFRMGGLLEGDSYIEGDGYKLLGGLGGNLYRRLLGICSRKQSLQQLSG